MTFVLIIILFSQDLLTFNSTCTYSLLCDFVNQQPNMCSFFPTSDRNSDRGYRREDPNVHSVAITPIADATSSIQKTRSDCRAFERLFV